MNKKYKALTLILLISLIFQVKSFALIKDKDKETILPSCTTDGEVECPKKYKPDCPEQYKPQCVFVTTKYKPGCLENSADSNVFNYHLDKIECRKK